MTPADSGLAVRKQRKLHVPGPWPQLERDETVRLPQHAAPGTAVGPARARLETPGGADGASSAAPMDGEDEVGERCGGTRTSMHVHPPEQGSSDVQHGELGCEALQTVRGVAPSQQCHGKPSRAQRRLILAEIGTVRYGFVAHRPPGPGLSCPVLSWRPPAPRSLIRSTAPSSWPRAPGGKAALATVRCKRRRVGSHKDR
jgi:hypothetical protein